MGIFLQWVCQVKNDEVLVKPMRFISKRAPWNLYMPQVYWCRVLLQHVPLCLHHQHALLYCQKSLMLNTPTFSLSSQSRIHLCQGSKHHLHARPCSQPARVLVPHLAPPRNLDLEPAEWEQFFTSATSKQRLQRKPKQLVQSPSTPEFSSIFIPKRGER